MSKDLYWQNDHTPASRRHDDIYFSTENGLRESSHVFLQGISAPEIWRKRDHFTLLENGFGSGLNFVLTCQEWLKTAPPDARMTYIATEKYPLTAEDISRILSCWPQLDREARELLSHYPPQNAGFHSRKMFAGRIKLLLLIGDSRSMLPRLEATVDAFYLDGFSPGRNPDMWGAEIFDQLTRLAAAEARLATFSAAGFVRRRLEKAGFTMSKSPGFGKKRECLRGKFCGSAPPSRKPWFDRPDPLSSGSSIAIIGGGIAGLTAGLALQNNGYKVTIFEQDHQPMDGASGNPAGILDPVLDTGDGPGAVFYRAALCHALDYYPALDPEIFLTRGLTKYAVKSGEKQEFPECGAISPPKIREILSGRLTIKSHQNITDITACGAADAVIICGGAASSQFPQTAPLPLEPVRGQITLLDADKYADPPQQVLCGKGYLVPPVNLDGRMTMVAGATYGRGDDNMDIRAQDHRQNLANAEILWPGVGIRPVTGGRTARRAHSPDHLPLCGPVPDFAGYKTAYEMLKHGPRHRDFPPAPCQPNLYMVTGLGSHGFMAAPLLAEILSAVISGQALPVPKAVYHALHPARFIIRSLKKAK